MTKGAEKYADRNWENGMKWSEGVIGSLMRHLQEFINGNDFDPEDGTLHIAKVAWNAKALTEYFLIHPEGDDRPKSWENMPKIGLDIDEVLAGFTDAFGTWEHKSGRKYPTSPTSWHYGYKFVEDLTALKENKEFWVDHMKPLIDPSELPFEPHCYITSRMCHREFTEEWLDKNGFPTVKIYHQGQGDCKADAAKDSGIDWFVDDNFAHFNQIRSAGVHCFLMDTSHNQRYDVGHFRLFDLREILSPKRLDRFRGAKSSYDIIMENFKNRYSSNSFASGVDPYVVSKNQGLLGELEKMKKDG
jgi:hypothetical protein